MASRKATIRALSNLNLDNDLNNLRVIYKQVFVLLRVQRYFHLFIQVLEIADYCSRLYKTNRKALRW